MKSTVTWYYTPYFSPVKMQHSVLYNIYPVVIAPPLYPLRGPWPELKPKACNHNTAGMDPHKE